MTTLIGKPDAVVAAIARVREQLAVYEGEPVVKDVHPRWHAVVALEKLCVYNPRQARQTHRLMPPAAWAWFALLWASRDGRPTYHPATYRPSNPQSDSTLPTPGAAVAWAKLLDEILEQKAKELQ